MKCSALIVSLVVLIFLVGCGPLSFALDNTKVYTNTFAIKNPPYPMNWYADGIVLPLASPINLENEANSFQFKTDYVYCLGASPEEDYIKNLEVGTVYKASYHILGRKNGTGQFTGINFVFIKLITITEYSPPAG
ncbi:MAG: hypothetical protein Q8Q06_01970 [bacterium]|nr:hypothetical protein [bacterium]